MCGGVNLNHLHEHKQYLIDLSRVFISFEAFCQTLIKKYHQNGEHRKDQVFIEGAEL